MNIELLLSYFQKGSFKVNLKGPHKRNVYNDIIGIEEGKDGVLYVDVGRNGLYNVLPEYMFHPIDRFNNLPQKEEKGAESAKAHGVQTGADGTGIEPEGENNALL